MIFRETRRFIKSSPLLSVSGVIVMALGFAASALAFTLLCAFGSLTAPGMKNISYATIAEQTEAGGSAPLSWERYEQLRTTPRPGVMLAAYSKPIRAEIGPKGQKKIVSISAVSANFFTLLSSNLHAGRVFSLAEEITPESHQAILSFNLATQLFQSPEQALEKTILMNDIPFEVIGVTPVAFHGALGNSAEAWVPAHCVIPLLLNVPVDKQMNPDVWKVIAAFFSVAASEYLPQHGLETVLNKTDVLQRAGSADLHVSRGLTSDPMRDERIRRWSRLGLILALFFTAMSSLDVCLLLLARAPAYVEEVRIKRALGAQMKRLAMELAVGPAVVMLTGLFASSALLFGALLAISRLSPFYKQLIYGSWHSLFWALSLQSLLAIVLILLVASIPAIYVFHEDTAPRLGHSSTASRRTSLLMQIPVVLQVACCMTTCILAGMIVASLLSMLKEPLGYNPDDTLVVSIAPEGIAHFSTGASGTSSEALALVRVIEQVKALPGVRSVSYVSNAPFDEISPATEQIQSSDDNSTAPRTVNEISVTPGYFKTAGSRLLAGNDVSSKMTGDVSEIVVNELLARELWSENSPIGQTVKIISPAWAGLPSSSYKAIVIGVVENSRPSGLATSPQPTFYISILGHPLSYARPQLMVNGVESARSLRELTNRIVPSFLPGMQVIDIYSVADHVKSSLAPEKQRLFWALGGALTMSAMAYIGLYGALAYYIRSRRRDLAIRICLGATPHIIRRIVFQRALLCTLPALILSLPMTLALKQLSSNEFLGKVSWSGTQASMISLLCVGISMMISLIPAKAANVISPSEVLKEQ